MKVAVNMEDADIRRAICDAVKKKTGVDIWPAAVKIEYQNPSLFGKEPWYPANNLRAIFSADEATYEW